MKMHTDKHMHSYTHAYTHTYFMSEASLVLNIVAVFFNKRFQILQISRRHYFMPRRIENIAHKMAVTINFVLPEHSKYCISRRF